MPPERALDRRLPRAGRRRDVCLALALAAPLLLVDLGGTLPSQRAEARVPVAARNMAADGLAPVPRLACAPWLNKPPLAVWLQALSMRVFGPTLAAACIPAVVLGAAMVAAVAARGGLAAGLILLLSPRFLLAARGTELDIVFAALATLAILRGMDEIRTRGRVGPVSQILLGLAVLTKGPLVLAFALLAWGRGALSPFAPLALVPAGAWLAWAASSEPRVVGYLAGQLRNASVGEHTTHVGPVHEYVVALPVLALPAVLPLLVLAIERVRAWGRGGPAPRIDAGGYAPDRDEEREERRLGAWLLGGLAILSVISLKQSAYALPLYAPLALLGARALERLDDLRSPLLVLAARALALALVGVPAAAAGLHVDLGMAAWAAAALAFAGALAVVAARDGRTAYRRALLAAVPVVVLGFLPLHAAWQRARSLVPVGERIAAQARARRLDLAGRVGVLRERFEEVSWGAGRDLPVVGSVEEARAAGLTWLVVERAGTDPLPAGAVVVLDVVNPRHRSRRLQVLDIEAEGTRSP